MSSKTIANQIVRMKKAAPPNTAANRWYLSDSYSAFHWAHGKPAGTTMADWANAGALEDRYARFCQYVAEVAPEWREVSKTLWMDNSVDSHQVCKCGKHERTVPLAPPSGDVCF